MPASSAVGRSPSKTLALSKFDWLLMESLQHPDLWGAVLAMVWRDDRRFRTCRFASQQRSNRNAQSGTLFSGGTQAALGRSTTLVA